MSLDRAEKLFEKFHGRKARADEIGMLKRITPGEVLQVGELEGLIYKASGDGKTYIHRFKKTARPVLYVTSDGQQIYVLAGAYKFTDRGFEDTSRPNRRKRK